MILGQVAHRQLKMESHVEPLFHSLLASNHRVILVPTASLSNKLLQEIPVAHDVCLVYLDTALYHIFGVQL